MSSVVLTDEQRDNVRRMLESLGGKVDAQEDQVIAEKDQGTDCFMSARSGSTIEWCMVSAGSYKYQFVRESLLVFVPLIISKTSLSIDTLKEMCVSLGMAPYESSSSLMTCSVEQSDPICMFHIEMEALKDTRQIKTIRYIC